MVTLKESVFRVIQDSHLSNTFPMQLNVLISDEGNALLCDFGLSKMISDMATMSGTPTELFGAGTIRWMAPELFSDEHGVEPKLPRAMYMLLRCWLLRLVYHKILTQVESLLTKTFL